MAIRSLPGWRWHYVYETVDGKRKQVDRFATDPQGAVHTVRETQDAQKAAERTAGVVRAPVKKRTRRFTRRDVSINHGRVTEVYFDTIDEAQDWFVKQYNAKSPEVMTYAIWYIQAIYTAMIAQRDTNTAKEVPHKIYYVGGKAVSREVYLKTQVDKQFKSIKTITQERAALSSSYQRLEKMGETDLSWNDARQREGNFTIRRIVLYGAER